MSNTMSKCQGVFTENFTVFFSNAGKAENVPGFKFDFQLIFKFDIQRFWKIIFGRLYTCNIYIIANRAPEFTQRYMCYKTF